MIQTYTMRKHDIQFKSVATIETFLFLVASLFMLNSLRPSDTYMRQWTNQHWFRQWIVAWTSPTHYLNQCWNIINCTIGNKLHWNINRNWYVSFKKIHLKMSSGKWRPFCHGLNMLKSQSVALVWVRQGRVIVLFVQKRITERICNLSCRTIFSQVTCNVNI